MVNKFHLLRSTCRIQLLLCVSLVDCRCALYNFMLGRESRTVVLSLIRDHGKE